VIGRTAQRQTCWALGRRLITRCEASAAHDERHVFIGPPQPTHAIAPGRQVGLPCGKALCEMLCHAAVYRAPNTTRSIGPKVLAPVTPAKYNRQY
jgi:hypothetical protein